jgi:hypothetical protein
MPRTYETQHAERNLGLESHVTANRRPVFSPRENVPVDYRAYRVNRPQLFDSSTIHQDGRATGLSPRVQVFNRANDTAVAQHLITLIGHLGEVENCRRDGK